MSDRHPEIDQAPPESSSRRVFLKSAAVGGALLGSGLLAACTNQPAPVAAPPTPAPAAPPAAPAQQAQPAQAAGDVLQKIARTKEVNVAVVIYPPLTIKKDGELTGSFIEAAKWLGKEMDAKVNFVEAEFGTFIAAIQSGRADIAMAPSYATVPRAMAVDFTRSIMWLGYIAMVRKADLNKWKTIEEADQPNVRFVQAEGTAVHRILGQNLKNAKLITLAPGTSFANQALEVLSNRADVYIDDDFLIRGLVQQHKEQLAEMPAYIDKPWRMNAVAWAVNKGQTPMLNVLNVAIDVLTDNGMWQQWDAKFGAHWLYRKDMFVQGV